MAAGPGGGEYAALRDAGSMQEVGSLNRGRQAVTPTDDRKSADRHFEFIVVAIIATAGILLIASLLRAADRGAAQTGDIIAFPATQVPSVGTAAFAARRAIVAGSMSCVLDVQTMQRSGGSLVVENSQFEPGRMFRVHWAGGRTSRGRDDCGSSADLLLNSNQIAALIFAAGGTGVKAQE
jgi:hypothetical protein